MTVLEWLKAREPRPPEALTTRLVEVLGADVAADIATGPDVMLRAGERLVAEMISGGSTSRESALDLLVADSLVTYAFEAASMDAASITPRATAAMTRIATLATNAA